MNSLKKQSICLLECVGTLVAFLRDDSYFVSKHRRMLSVSGLYPLTDSRTSQSLWQLKTYPYISKCLPPPRGTTNLLPNRWYMYQFFTRLHEVDLNVLNINLKRTETYHSNISILHNNPILTSHLWLSKCLAKIPCIAYVNSWGKQCFKFATTIWKFYLFKFISPYNTKEICNWHSWLPSLQPYA